MNKRNIREKYRFCNLYIKGLPDSLDDEKLRSLFEKYGKIRSCRTVRKEMYQSYLGIKRSVKVSGFVCFEESKNAKEAKTELNNANPFPNHKLFVDFHQSKAERNEFLKLQMINNTNKAFQSGMSGQGDQNVQGYMFKNKGINRNHNFNNKIISNNVPAHVEEIPSANCIFIPRWEANARHA